MNDQPPISDQSAQPETSAAVRPTESREAWRSEELLGERSEVEILHNNEVYRLRRTRQGKLILYK